MNPPEPPGVARPPTDNAHFTLTWVDRHRTATQPADPTYPNGIEISAALDQDETCRVAIPYPAPRCGIWSVKCLRCGITVALTAAGRRDDPISLTVPCRHPDRALLDAAG